MDDPDLALTKRTGLPPALRVLVEAMPRLSWHAHADFEGLAAFWLDRHMAFRRLTATTLADAEARLDGAVDPAVHAARLSRLGAVLLGDLHGHHQIEDAHFFPMMTMIEPRVAAAFTLLDADHHALDGLLHQFTGAANAVIGAATAEGNAEGAAATDAFHLGLLRFDGFLARHLEDEEDIVVPVILAHGL